MKYFSTENEIFLIKEKCIFQEYPPHKVAGILLSFTKEISDTAKVILDEVLKERKREERTKSMERSPKKAHRGQHKMRSGSSDYGSFDRSSASGAETVADSGNGLEEFLDAVAAKTTSSGKRRRSKKMNLQQLDSFNIATL